MKPPYPFHIFLPPIGIYIYPNSDRTHLWEIISEVSSSYNLARENSNYKIYTYPVRGAKDPFHLDIKNEKHECLTTYINSSREALAYKCVNELQLGSLTI